MRTVGTLALFGPQIIGSVARPWSPANANAQSPNLKKRVTLSKTSSCNDLTTYQTENDLSHIQADMYDMLDTHGVLDDWFFSKANDDGLFTNYVTDFAAPWGVGQTMVCGLPNECPRLNCKDLQDPSAPGSGPAYAALLSFANFNNYLNDLYISLNIAQTRWASIQVSVQQKYWPNVPAPIILKEILVGITAVVGVIGAASGVIGAATAAVVGSGAALVGGVLGGINAALVDSDESLPDLAELEENELTYYQAIFNMLAWTNNNLTETGSYSGVGGPASLADIVAEGQWLDYTDHAVLNNDQSKPQVTTDALTDAWYSYLLGQTILYAWKAQGTFIVKYDMTEDDFNNGDWNAGNGDSRFRVYYGGSAFFLQRYMDDQDPLQSQAESAYPPGWGDLGNDLGGCDPACVMRSSADAWHMYGFNFNFSTTSTSLTQDQSTAQQWLTSLPSAPGFWNIPICELTGSDQVDSVDKLSDVLEDQNFSYGNQAPRPIWCYCQDVTDAQGLKFSDPSVYPSEIGDLFEDSLVCEDGYDKWNE